MSDTLSVRAFDLKTHYPIVSAWWFERYRVPLDFHCLSRMGLIAFKGETPICAVWVLLTNSQIAIMSFIVSNPEASIRAISDAVNLLVFKAEGMCRRIGYMYLIGISTSAGFSKRLKRKHEFTPWRLHELLFKKVIHD